MEKKGFTLIELLAVIVILAIIAVIAVPTKVTIINNAQKSAFKDSAYGIIKSGEMYYTDKMMEESGMTEDKTFTFPEATGLEVKGSRPSNGIMIVTKEGKIALAIHNGKYCATKGYNADEVTISENVSNCSFVVAYKEIELHGADPELSEGMIPITITNEGVATVADIYNETTPWYEYGQKRWANVVTVTSASRSKYIENGTYKSGTEVSEADILTYLTWIPRYKYKLWNVDSFSTTGVDVSQVHSIDIVFESKNTNKSNGSTNGSYLTHPAFTFGEISEGISNEVNGMWVGKFETGYSGTEPGNVAAPEKLVIKPNMDDSIVYSWTNIGIINAFSTAIGMSNQGNEFGLSESSNPHMMKNIEWGAVAYLSHSKYGIDYEVRLNNFLDSNDSNHWRFKTGCGALTKNKSASISCENQYGTVTSYPQSTTGNITGIFDMAGGAFEYVMGMMNNPTGNLSPSISGKKIDPKYYDLYKYENDNVAYHNRILGDATGELGPFSGNHVSSWYDDAAWFTQSTAPYIRRGDTASSGNPAGVFAFSTLAGGAFHKNSFRIVMF